MYRIISSLNQILYSGAWEWELPRSRHRHHIRAWGRRTMSFVSLCHLHFISFVFVFVSPLSPLWLQIPKVVHHGHSHAHSHLHSAPENISSVAWMVRTSFLQFTSKWMLRFSSSFFFWIISKRTFQNITPYLPCSSRNIMWLEYQNNFKCSGNIWWFTKKYPNIKIKYQNNFKTPGNLWWRDPQPGRRLGNRGRLCWWWYYLFSTAVFKRYISF